MNLNNVKIAVIGLGYVGLPLAVEFGCKFMVTGFDINETRIKELINGIDTTLEITSKELKKSSNLKFSNKLDDIKDCNIFIVTVPTPIDEHKKPDLTLLTEASDSIGSFLKKGDIVIYESTVYPGATEEICVPVLEKKSGLTFNKDFYCGYSPERINPGDRNRNIKTIKKVTSGSTPNTAIKIDHLYKQIITAGTFMATSIKVAEAAKVIENTQRDVNIALINELSIIFNKLNIDTESVLEAASTKWNFMSFKPGLVGGHCIGVDPYYLTHKALETGYNPEIILAGRRINDNMAFFVVDQVLNLMIQNKICIEGADILVMGLTFKENCPDIRNTKIKDLVLKFKSHECKVDVYDPWADKEEALNKYQIEPIEYPKKGGYDAIILAVAHDKFINLNIEQIKSFGKDSHIIYDIKHIFAYHEVDGRL
jgi:UDP-N-acetyl-D-glucosamine/UDP-N-acetyl-D-galactosamine dehydrogenase